MSAEILRDLGDRCWRAEDELRKLAAATSDREEARRLESKRMGVALAHGYIREALRMDVRGGSR